MQHAQRVLEFERVKTDIQSFVACSLGRTRLDLLGPYRDVTAAEAELTAVDEALQFVFRFGAPGFGGVTDVRPALQKTIIGGVLSAKDLLAVANFIYGGRSVRQNVENRMQDMELTHLQQMASQLFDARQTEGEIRRQVLEDATIADTASPALQRLRHERRQLERRVRQILDEWLRRHQRVLQDPVIAMRGDSLCLPVRVEFKSQVPGIVHDVSASGATVFIEPQPVAEANQRVQSLLTEEGREIERILQALSAFVADAADALLSNAEVLATLDAWFAKASHAKAHKWSIPVLRTDGTWHLRQARHPLLDAHTAVPVDITLGESYRMLLVTGPNTGGKTVTLKTLGLLTLLAMSGCFISTGRASEVAWCDDVYVDIGDEQSIEQSLSTFSSHMRNVVPLFSEVTANSLVLLDELGAGTDPTEGAALAVAILDELKERGCRVAVTTHYPELKAYAFREPSAVNASVEFDVETLQPTYRLSIGIPGRSNALAIAQRLGMPRSVLSRARAQLSSEDVRVEDLIVQMQRARQESEAAASEAKKQLEQAAQLRSEWERRTSELDAAEQRLLDQAQERAKREIELAQAEAQRIIRELREMREHSSAGIKDHELVALRKQLEEALPQATGNGRKRRRRHDENPTTGSGVSILPGASVRVLTLGQKGEVIEVNDDTLTVQMGALRTKVAAADVELLQNRVAHAVTSARRPGLPKEVRLELDIRGETVEDGQQRVDKYLDDAVVSGLARVAVIHGKGTGALRDAVRRQLSSHPHVGSWAPGGAGEGGDGVTVVSLRK